MPAHTRVLVVIVGLGWCGPTAGWLAAQTLQVMQVAQPNTANVEIFADGNVKNVIAQASGATTVQGSLGIRYRGDTYLVTGSINLGGTLDTVAKNFGASILAPATGRALNAGLLEVRRPRISGDATCVNDWTKIHCNFGWRAYATLATARWATNLDTNGKTTATVDVPAWGLGAGLSYAFVNGKVDTNTVGMLLDVGLTLRGIRGDLSVEDTTRARLLGTKSTDFAGLEFGLNLQYNQIKAGLTYYYLSGSLPGLSHGQIVAGASIQADLVSGILRSP